VLRNLQAIGNKNKLCKGDNSLKNVNILLKKEKPQKYCKYSTFKAFG
jgi:hypothetical protein